MKRVFYICFILFSLNQFAQDGSLDLAFNPGIGATELIYTAALQTDGKIVIGGNFDYYEGVSRDYIARLDNDGSLDNSFIVGTGTNGTVIKSVVLPDGKIIIAGVFSNYNGTSAGHIARLNSDGTLDATFNLGGVGANNYIYSVALLPDGKILICGGFTTFNGVARNRMARLNSDGSLDSTFDVGSGFNDLVLTMAVQSDGKILAGGSFNTFQGVSQNRIVRLNSNGSKDVTFNVGNGADNIVRTIALQNDNKVLVGGNFVNFAGVSKRRITRLNSNGSQDVSFNPSGNAANDIVFGIKLQADNQILVSGRFTTFNSINTNHLVRLNENGAIDTNFNIGSGANEFVYSIEIQPDNKIVICGDFTQYNGVTRNKIARIDSVLLNADDFNYFDNSILAFVNSNENIQIQSTNSILHSVCVYDITGKRIASKNEINAPHYEFRNEIAKNQILFLQIKLNNDKVIFKKISI